MHEHENNKSTSHNQYQVRILLFNLTPMSMFKYINNSRSTTVTCIQEHYLIDEHTYIYIPRLNILIQGHQKLIFHISIYNY